MSTALEKLTQQRVEQLMARDVITIHENESMVEAANLMKNYGISGVPVVDDFGRCVGVLTATDFVESKSEERCHCVSHVSTTVDDTGLNRAAMLDEGSVRAHMSSRLQTIREYRSIVDAGQIMCQEHIHRLIVIDRQARPVGIISSLDLVSALVNAQKD